jgi:hypothetical protein
MAALAITIPITLSGKDANGVEFTEKTRTIVIDRRGGKIATKCDLTLGSEMTLHNPLVGQTARIRVIWVGEKRATEEPHEVGVQVLGSENIWGIDFPFKRLEGGLRPSRPDMQQLGAELEEPKPTVQNEMGKTSRQVQESRPKLVEVATSDLEMMVKKEIDSVANELIDLSQKRVQEEVAAALEPLIQGALERVYSAAEEQSVRAEEYGQDLLSRVIQEGQAQLARLLQSTVSEFQKEIHQISGATIASAQTEIAQAWSKSAVGFEAQLQKTADEVAESAAQQLQKQAEDTLLMSGEELKTSGNNYMKRLEESLTKAAGEQQQSAVGSFRKALEKECGETLALAKSEATQAIRGVSEQVERDVEALNNLRNSLGEKSVQALTKFQQDLEQVMEEVADQVQQRVNMLCSLLNLMEKDSAQLFSQFKNDLEENLRLFGEELKLKQEQVASGTAEAFRSKIVEMLSVFQLPPSSFTP